MALILCGRAQTDVIAYPLYLAIVIRYAGCYYCQSNDTSNCIGIISKKGIVEEKTADRDEVDSEGRICNAPAFAKKIDRPSPGSIDTEDRETTSEREGLVVTISESIRANDCDLNTLHDALLSPRKQPHNC